MAIYLSAESGSVTQGASTSFVATVVGISGSAYITISGLPEGARSDFGANPVPLEFMGTPDNVSLSFSMSTPPGFYNITLTANASDAIDTANYELHVQKAVVLTVEFSTSDGTYGSSPSFNYTYNGADESISLTQTPQMVYADNGSKWSVENEFNESNPGERWITNQTTDGIVNNSQTIDFSFYHQYQVTFGYSVVGDTTPDTAPVVNYSSFGTTANIGLNGTGSTLWVDSLSTYSYTPSIFSNESLLARWAAGSNQTGEITNSTSVVAQDHLQYLVMAGYGVLGGGSGFSAPNATFQNLGSNVNTTLQSQPKAYWVDTNSTWSYPKILSGSTTKERWISTNSTVSVSVDSPLSISLNYQNQYFVSVSSISPSAGQVDPRSGWFNSGETIAFSASANSGWKFTGWTSSGTVASNGTVVVDSPINETAQFDAGLVLSASPGGQLIYNVGSAQGTISGGSSQTMYVVPGTMVFLSASPSSTLYSFGKWSIGSDTASSSASYSVSVSTPTSITAYFGPNYLIFVLLGIVTFVGVAFAMFFIAKRRKPKVDSPVEREETDDF